MKKFLVICLSFMIFSCALCFMGNEVKASNEVVTLRFAGWGILDKSTEVYFKEMAKEFEEENPNIKIEYLGFPYGDTAQQVLIMCNAGDAPDVVQADSSTFNSYVGSGFVAPLDNLFSSDYINDIYLNVRKNMSSDGKLYAIPWMCSPYVLIYNKDLFEEAGLNPDYPPKTYDEMIKYAIEISKLKDANGNYIYGLGETTASVPVSGESVLSTMLSFGGGIYDKDGNIDVNNEGNIRAFNFYKELYKEKLNPESAKLKDLRNLMAIGRLGMYFDQIWGIVNAISINPDIKNKVALTSMPSTDYSDGLSIMAAHELLIMKDCKHKEEAVKFVEFVTSKKMLIKYYQASSPFLAGRISINESEDFGDTYILPVKNSLDNVKCLERQSANLTSGLLELTSAAQRATIGQEKSENVVKKLETKLKQVLK